MSSGKWMIYGANGFTGQLIAEAAVRRGHKPVLAGRSEEKLAPLAERLGLDMVVLDLQEGERLKQVLEGVNIVLNAAGPFVHTALPIIQACLETGTSYLDISGEVTVLEEIFALDQQASERGIAIIPGVGFNVLASDCLVLYAVEKVDTPTELEIAALWATEGMSPGSTKTMYENLPVGTLARREGQLVRINVRDKRRQQQFLDGEYPILPVAIGDLITAYRTTRIPNITTYTAFTEKTVDDYSRMEPILRRLFGFAFVRRIASSRVEKTSPFSGDYLKGRKPSQVWVSVRNEEGKEFQAWLETVESYTFTAEASVLCTERLLSKKLVGVLTPAQAFGADFVLEIPGTKRMNRLESV